MRLIGACVVLVTLAIYTPVLDAGWVYEDHNWIGELGNGGVAKWPGRSLTMWTFDVQAGVPVGAYHAANVGLHLLVGGLVFAIGPLLGLSTLASMAGAAVFLWHPLNTQAVAYVSARTDLLMAFFALFAVLVARLGGRGSLVAALVCCALATASKELGLVSFGLVALVDRQARWWIGGVGLVALYLYLPKLPGLIGLWPTQPEWWALATANAGGVWRLLALWVVPVGMSIDPDPWAVPVAGRVLAFVALVAVLAVVAWRQRPMTVLAVGSVALVLVPRVLVPTFEPVMEHHAYLATVPLALVSGAWIAKGWEACVSV